MDINRNYNEVGLTTSDGNQILLAEKSSYQTDSRCWINLSYQKGEKHIPRWFSINQMLSSTNINGDIKGDLYDGAGNLLTLGDFTINELKNPVNKLYRPQAEEDYQIPENNRKRFYGNLND